MSRHTTSSPALPEGPAPRSARRPRALLAAICSLVLLAALPGCAGGSDEPAEVPGGRVTRFGPVTVALPQNFHELEMPNRKPEVSHYGASSDPKGGGGQPKFTVTYTHRRKVDAELAGEQAKALLTSGYGGKSRIDRDEEIDVPGSSGAWRLGFTRTIRATTHRAGWVLAEFDEGIVLIVADSPESQYDALALDAVLASVTLS